MCCLSTTVLWRMSLVFPCLYGALNTPLYARLHPSTPHSPPSPPHNALSRRPAPSSSSHTSNSSMLHLCALPEHGHRHSVHMNDTFSSTAQPVLRLQEYTAPGTDQLKKCTGVPPGTSPTLRQFHHTYSWFTNSSITPSCSMAVSSRNTTLRNIAATSSDLEALD